MKKKLTHTLLVVLFLAVATYSQGQTSLEKSVGVLTGTVRDQKTGTPLIGAAIKAEGSDFGCISDSNGNFTLHLINGKKIHLFVNYVGYKPITREIIVNEHTISDFVLEEDALNLNEVVVVGYVQTKRNAKTSAISEIKSEQIKNIAGAGFNEQIQGQAPGLLVSTTSGTPGSSVFVRLRGATSINAGNDPLYVIDGVPINNKTLQTISIGGQTTNALADLNPADIENVEILKDANATAVYGARGANGVILITTKRGNNSATRINFDAEYGFAKAAKLWKLATGPDHAEILNEAWVNDGKSYATRPYRPTSEGGLGNPEDQSTYDRQSLAFRTASVQTYNISASGGNDKTTFFIGSGYTSQQAIVRTQDYSRYNFRVNLDHKVSDHLTLGTSNFLDYSIRSLSRTANSPKGILQASVHTATLLPIYNADRSYAKYGIFDNIVALIKNNNHHAYGLRSINNLYAKWNILENLSFKSSFSVDLNNYHEKRYFNTQLSDGQPNGAATDATDIEQSWVAEQLVNYFTTIHDVHFISLFLGNTIQKRNYQNETINASGFPSDEFQTISSAAVTSGSTSTSASSLISYFGGANYSFNNKYSIDVNIRADASSRFGKSNRWGYFPSVGTSWRIGEEKWIKNNLKFINELKVKASIGWTGNQDIDDFASQGLWAGGANYGDTAGITSSQLSNPNLKWETTRQWNIGIETSLLSNRLSFEVDYYNKYTYNLLLNTPVPGKTGYSSTIQNIGAMSNKGFELQINSVNIKSKNYEWNTSFQLSHNENLIEKLPISFSQYSRDWVRLEQGHPMYSFWLYKQLYVDPQTGNAVYQDVNKDGKITTADRQIVGNAWPKFTGGLRNTLRYKNFDLSAFIYFSVGNDVFNMNRFFQEHGGVRGTNWGLLKSQMRRWQKVGDITDIPRASTKVNSDGSYNNDFQSSRFLENGSFLRLRNLTIGYTLPQNLIAKVGLTKLRFYVSGTNVFTITKYSGADPEGNTAADQTNGTVQGLDFAIPPQPRQIIFGANITL
jgi:TonB-linked SusC/RagA family outer membrane protein